MRVNIRSPLEETICSCSAVGNYLSEIFMFNKTILLDDPILYLDKEIELADLAMDSAKCPVRQRTRLAIFYRISL